MTTRIEEIGFWVESAPYSKEGRWDINYSSILTKLIQSAGKYCKHYASDLFIDWKAVDALLNAGEPINETKIFAMRDMGVDHKEYYEIKKSKPDIYGSESYHEVWKLEIVTEGSDITMTLELIEN